MKGNYTSLEAALLGCEDSCLSQIRQFNIDFNEVMEWFKEQNSKPTAKGIGLYMLNVIQDKVNNIIQSQVKLATRELETEEDPWMRNCLRHFLDNAKRLDAYKDIEYYFEINEIDYVIVHNYEIYRDYPNLWIYIKDLQNKLGFKFIN